ncbi:MAG: DUF5671 domain-containing protein [Candidatus Liptonbacteria bacterium]|nr:DUF5671 domain-containing protein [Candidatus Liptonbacteria bacterium]
MENQIQKTYPRDVFMYLLNTITLYVSTFSFLNLVFEYINIAFPDKLNFYYNPGDSVRWTLSLFIIIFGVFVWTSKFIEKDLVGNPDKSDLKIRKWLIYLTIFLAALLLIGDLVALIYNFLGGDLTAPFILKVLSVFAVGGVTFWYYLYNLKKNPGEFSPKAKIIIWSSIVIALAVIVCGFYFAGSPFKQRSVKFDNQRVSDLQTIQSQTVYYWQQKEKLPQSLNDLKDSISGFIPPSDPDTNQPYEYRVTGNLSFEFCSEFALSSDESAATQRYAYPTGIKDNWNHSAGRVCFSRSIDPELYRTNNTKPLAPSIQ